MAKKALVSIIRGLLEDRHNNLTKDAMKLDRTEKFTPVTSVHITHKNITALVICSSYINGLQTIKRA